MPGEGRAPMCTLDHPHTRHPPSRLAPTEPTSSGQPYMGNCRTRFDPILGEHLSKQVGLASLRAPPFPLPQGWLVPKIKIYFLIDEE